MSIGSQLSSSTIARSFSDIHEAEAVLEAPSIMPSLPGYAVSSLPFPHVLGSLSGYLSVVTDVLYVNSFSKFTRNWLMLELIVPACTDYSCPGAVNRVAVGPCFVSYQGQYPPLYLSNVKR
jgi:hypothetical protein